MMSFVRALGKCILSAGALVALCCVFGEPSAFMARADGDAGNILGKNPLENIDMNQLKETLEKNVPKEMKSYMKQAVPFITVVANQLKSEKCKGAINELSVLAQKASKKGTKTKLGEFAAAVCDVDTTCVIELLDSLETFLGSNDAMKSASDNFLSKYNLKMATLKPMIPVMIGTMCASIDEHLEPHRGEEGSNKDEL